MTDVRVRHESDQHPVTVGDIPLPDIDKVVPLLGRWGVMVRGGDTYGTDSISGQFVLDPESAAYFEVQLHE